MQEINQSNDDIIVEIKESNSEIGGIIQIIQEIGSKTRIINDIVFQTKILSFNASVEAARAGEHGKGFSVVAEEVGKLAQMSGDAAQEISQLLDESISKFDDITTMGDAMKILSTVLFGLSLLTTAAHAQTTSKIMMNLFLLSADLSKISVDNLEELAKRGAEGFELPSTVSTMEDCARIADYKLIPSLRFKSMQTLYAVL